MSMTTVVCGVSFTEEEMRKALEAAQGGRDPLIETLKGMDKQFGLDYVGWGQLLNSLLSTDHAPARAAA